MHVRIKETGEYKELTALHERSLISLNHAIGFDSTITIADDENVAVMSAKRLSGGLNGSLKRMS